MKKIHKKSAFLQEMRKKAKTEEIDLFEPEEEKIHSLPTKGL